MWSFQSCFDSILVRLKAFWSYLTQRINHCFDSILVRLKAEFIIPSESSKETRFDSILVRLKVNLAMITHQLFHGFDSILVRLKGDDPVYVLKASKAVSIPYWFD